MSLNSLKYKDKYVIKWDRNKLKQQKIHLKIFYHYSSILLEFQCETINKI